MPTYALTGGASGIGAALARQLREAGNEVIIVDLKDAAVTADLSTAQGRSEAVAGVRELAPNGLDGLIPLAGVGAATGHPPALITALNYFGAIAMVEGLRADLARRRGAVVLLCSNSAAMVPHEFPLIEVLLAGDENTAIEATEREANGLEYMAGKRALNYWMRRNALAYAREGIRMNAVAPGPTASAMTDALFAQPGMKEVVDGLLKATPISRMGGADEVANAIRFLLSDQASYVCGTTIFVDGGYDAATRTDHL